MKKMISVFLLFALMLTTSFAGETTKKAKAGNNQENIVCVNNTFLAVESDGVFVFTDEKSIPIPCTSIAATVGRNFIRPIGDRMTLSSGSVVRKDYLMSNWLWVKK